MISRIFKKSESKINERPEGPPDMELFCIYDNKARYYQNPILAMNAEDMLRQLENLFMDPTQQFKNQYVTNPEDFAVFKTGEFHRRTGLIIGHTPEHICNIHEIRDLVRGRALTPGIGST